MFSGDTVPYTFKDAPHFLLNNPVALQKKYLKVKDDPNVTQRSTDSRDALKADEQTTLNMMVKLFHWLDSLELQPTTEIVPPRHISAWMDQVTSKKAQNSAMFAFLAAGTRVLSAWRTGCEFEPHNQPQSGKELVRKVQQTREGEIQIDHAMINASFRDTKDPLSAQRRVVLERILQSIWFQSHELEPQVSGPYDELTGGLGVSGRSVYTCFLKFVTSQEGGSGGSGGKWVCLFGDESHPCPKARWEKGFNKPERAIEHARSHLGHCPFWCNNECDSNPPWYVLVLRSGLAISLN